MRFTHCNMIARKMSLAVCILLLEASWAVAQQQVNLIAGPTSATCLTAHRCRCGDTPAGPQYRVRRRVARN